MPIYHVRTFSEKDCGMVFPHATGWVQYRCELCPACREHLKKLAPVPERNPEPFKFLYPEPHPDPISSPTYLPREESHEVTRSSKNKLEKCSLRYPCLGRAGVHCSRKKPCQKTF